MPITWVRVQGQRRGSARGSNALSQATEQKIGTELRKLKSEISCPTHRVEFSPFLSILLNINPDFMSVTGRTLILALSIHNESKGSPCVPGTVPHYYLCRGLCLADQPR